LKGGKMSAYENCKWCHGNGCNQCNFEREKRIKEYEKNGPQPIFSMKINPDGTLEDPELAKSCIGKDALEKAFGPEGGGVREIELNCAVASLIQQLRKNNPESSPEKVD
jgi:hypothetical protein